MFRAPCFRRACTAPNAAALVTHTAARRGVLIVALGGSLVLGIAQAQPSAPAPVATVRCASAGYQYQYCPVPTGLQVVLTRQRSRAPCRLNETWGYDAGGIWVDQGCAAEFRVGAASAATVPDRGIGPVRPTLPRPLPGAQPSRWAYNTYIGSGGQANEIRLTVGPDGTVQGRTRDGTTFAAFITDTWLQTDRARFRLQTSGTGFLATDERDPKHQIQFDVEMARN